MADISVIRANLTIIRDSVSAIEGCLNRWEAGQIEAGVKLTVTQKGAIFQSVKDEFNDNLLPAGLAIKQELR